MRYSLFSSAFAVVLATRAASACPVDTSGEAHLSTAWQTAIERLKSDLASVDGPNCPRIAVVVGQTTRIEATLPDGRSATRVVHTPVELSSVAFGLLESIPPEPTPEVELVPEPPPVTMTLPVIPSPRPSPATRPSAVSSSMGLSFGTRLAMPFGVVASDVELGTDVVVQRWIFGAYMRGSPLGMRLSDDDIQYRQWSFGGGVGRWFSVGRGGIAWTAGPGFEQTSFARGNMHRERDDLLLATTTRYVTPFGTRWHPTIAAEVDTMPALALADGERNRAGREGFPALSAALRIGLVGDPL